MSDTKWECWQRNEFTSVYELYIYIATKGVCTDFTGLLMCTLMYSTIRLYDFVVFSQQRSLFLARLLDASEKFRLRSELLGKKRELDQDLPLTSQKQYRSAVQNSRRRPGTYHTIACMPAIWVYSFLLFFLFLFLQDLFRANMEHHQKKNLFRFACFLSRPLLWHFHILFLFFRNSVCLPIWLDVCWCLRVCQSVFCLSVFLFVCL